MASVKRSAAIATVWMVIGGLVFVAATGAVLYGADRAYAAAQRAVCGLIGVDLAYATRKAEW